MPAAGYRLNAACTRQQQHSKTEFLWDVIETHMLTVNILILHTASEAYCVIPFSLLDSLQAWRMQFSVFAGLYESSYSLEKSFFESINGKHVHVFHMHTYFELWTTGAPEKYMHCVFHVWKPWIKTRVIFQTILSFALCRACVNAFPSSQMNCMSYCISANSSSH